MGFGERREKMLPGLLRLWPLPQDLKAARAEIEYDQRSLEQAKRKMLLDFEDWSAPAERGWGGRGGGAQEQSARCLRQITHGGAGGPLRGCSLMTVEKRTNSG